MDDTGLDEFAGPEKRASYEEAKARAEGLTKSDPETENVARFCAAGAFPPLQRNALQSLIHDKTKLKISLIDAAMRDVERADARRKVASKAASQPQSRFRWPDGFEVQDGKLGCFKKSGESDPYFVPICSPFNVLGLERDENGDAFSLLLAFADRTGRARKISIPYREVALGLGEVLAKLAEAGLAFTSTKDAREGLVRCLSELEAPEVITKVSRPGWHAIDDGAHIFVTPTGEVVGLEREGIGAFRLGTGVGADDQARAGSLDGWKSAAAAAFQVPENFHWALGVMAGFAGTLIQLSDLDTCGMNLSGRTSRGKTTAQRLAASAWANPKAGKGLLHTFNTSSTALESLAVRGVGTVLALDELAQADTRTVGSMLFMLAGGAGKSRSLRTIQNRKVATFSTFAILSGEAGLRSVVEAGRGTYQGGMAARFPDVDVSETVDVSPKTFALVEGCRKNYGHAGVVFVRHLFEVGLADDGEKLHREITNAANAIAGVDAPAPRRRAALPFAVLSRAGELAIDAGLLPRDADVAGAVQKAWEAYVGGAEAEMLDGTAVAIERLRAALATGWNTSVIALKAVGSGYHGWTACYDGSSIYVPVGKLMELIGTGVKVQAVVKELVRLGLLNPQGAHMTWEKIPGGSRVRHYRLVRDAFAPSEDGDNGEMIQAALPESAEMKRLERIFLGAGEEMCPEKAGMH